MKPKMKQKAHDVMDQLDTELGEVEEAKSVLEVERDEYKNKLLRALADYHNLEKRVADERQELGRRAVQNFILRILPFLDNLEQAEVFVKDKGLEIVKTSFLELLEKEGLKKIDVLNKEYDIHVAEAIDLVEGERTI
ncbi:nucleotide exchange factor GrpE [Candidatus Roizmanbacteria bacterium]|nr:MAG: nucleotide exchange factor GrpE [Candidatus Roizmanbacteria bacterium]